MRRDADAEVIAAFEGGLGGCAENGGRSEVMNQTTESPENGMEKR